MSMVNILEAKTHLSRLVEDIASGAKRSIVIARNGKPVAELVPIRKSPIKFGLLKGKYVIPDDIDADNAEIAEMFNSGNLDV